MLERPSSSSSHPSSDCSAGCALGVVEERPFAIMANFHTPSQFRVVGAAIHEPSMRIVSALDVARRGDVACRIDHSVSSHSAHLPQPTFLQSSTVTTNQRCTASITSGAGRTRLHSDCRVHTRGIGDTADGDLGRQIWIYDLVIPECPRWANRRRSSRTEGRSDRKSRHITTPMPILSITSNRRTFSTVFPPFCRAGSQAAVTPRSAVGSDSRLAEAAETLARGNSPTSLATQRSPEGAIPTISRHHLSRSSDSVHTTTSTTSPPSPTPALLPSSRTEET